MLGLSVALIACWIPALNPEVHFYVPADDTHAWRYDFGFVHGRTVTDADLGRRKQIGPDYRRLLPVAYVPFTDGCVRCADAGSRNPSTASTCRKPADWNPDADSPYNGKKGAYQTDGKRYRPGEWPREPIPVYPGGGAP